jgi:hypothetical protein
VIRKKRISTLNHSMYLGQVKFTAIPKGEGIKLASSYDEEGAFADFSQRLLK